MEMQEQIDSKNDAMTAAAMIDAEYIIREDLAKGLKKSVRTLDRWHALRIGPPRTVIGKTILYRREAVSSWLRSREDGARDGRKRRRAA
jgi:hypothetical protein